MWGEELISSTDKKTDIPKDSNIEPYENARRLSILRRQRKVLIVDDLFSKPKKMSASIRSTIHWKHCSGWITITRT
jgi:hypothetical protein